MQKIVLFILVSTLFLQNAPSLFAQQQNGPISEIDELSSLGISLMKQGRFEESISYFDQVLQINPNDSIALANKGAALTHMKKYDEAITYYDKALSLDPKNISTLNNKAATLFEMRKFDQSLSTLEEILKIMPNNIEIMMKKGQVLFEAKNYVKSFTVFNNILEIDPQNNEARKGSHSAVMEIKLKPITDSKYFGYVILEVRNASGVLVSVTQTTDVGYLPHQITDEYLDSTPALEKVIINGKTYEKRKFVERLHATEDIFIGRATLGYDKLGYDIYPFDILPHGILVENGDTLNAYWAILREVT